MSPFDADQRTIDKRFAEITAGLEDDLAPIRGIAIWVPVSVAAWIAIGMTVWAVAWLIA